MKRLLLIIVASVAIAFSSLAQTAADTKGISFQGIARDNTGNVYASKTISVVFTIQNGTTTVYQETQTGLTTDVAGVFSTYIGSSSATVNTTATATTYGSFDKVDFSKQYNIQVSVAINGGSSVIIGSYSLQAVPYAKFATLAQTATNALNGVPPGCMMAYAGPIANIPTGWLYCNGTAVSRTTYAALFAAIGTSWGSGDNATTFNLPYTLGEFLRGVNDGSNNDPDAATRTATKTGGNVGDKVGSSEADENKSHNHTGTTNTTGAHTHNFTHGVEGDDSGSGNSYNEFTMVGGSVGNVMTTNGDHNHTLNINNTDGKESRPKNVSVYYIIKY